MQWIFWYDWILMPLYIFLLVKIFFSFAKKRYSGKIYKYFRYGFLAKMTGALGFAFYHQYIYGGGDTFLFFDTGLKISDFVSTDFTRFIALVFKPVESTVDYHFEVLDSVVFAEPNFFVPRLTAILSLITFRSYLAICLIFSAISFAGIWYAYSSLLKLYPAFQKEFALAFLFIPSVVLWGSGLGKDSLTLGCTCLVFGALLRLFLIPKQGLFKNLILLAIGFFVVTLIKPYIIYSFSLSFAIGILFQRIANMKNKGMKVFMAIMLVMGSLAATFVGYGYIISDPNFGLDLVSEKVIALNKNLGTQSGAGSAYDLGLDVSSVNSFTDIIPVFPKSIFVTLFRPFLWEISNPAMLLSALESFIFFMLLLYILLKRKIFGVIPLFLKNPLAISCLLYTLIFAGLIGISSGNFGTLVRYKIPCLPFFGLMLALLYGDKIIGSKSPDKLPDIV